jgi:hypothetical protein
MAFEDTDTFPILVPVPKFDCHVVGASEHKGLGWVNRDTSDITTIINKNNHGRQARLLWMSFKSSDLLLRIEIEHSL